MTLRGIRTYHRGMIPVQIEDAILAGHLASIPSDGVSIFTLGGSEGPNGGEVRGAILSATSLVASMRASHGLGILETLILGQAYMAALLMASMLKGEDRLALRVDCDGPARGLAVEGRASTGKDGRRRNEVRGCLFENPIPVSIGREAGQGVAPSARLRLLGQEGEAKAARRGAGDEGRDEARLARSIRPADEDAVSGAEPQLGELEDCSRGQAKGARPEEGEEVATRRGARKRDAALPADGRLDRLRSDLR